jgi:hypothetical protein
MLRQTVDNRAPLLLFPSFSPSYCDVSYALSYFAFTIVIASPYIPREESRLVDAHSVLELAFVFVFWRDCD